MPDNVKPQPDENYDFDSPQAIAEMNRRQARLGLLAQEVALAALVELKQKLATATPLNLSGDEARSLLDAGMRLERAARGLQEPEEGQPLLEGYPPKKPN